MYILKEILSSLKDHPCMSLLKVYNFWPLDLRSGKTPLYEYTVNGF